MKKDYIKQPKNAFAKFFKKVFSKTKSDTPLKPEDQVKKESRAIRKPPRKERSTHRPPIFSSQVEAIQKRKRKIKNRMAKESRRINRD